MGNYIDEKWYQKLREITSNIGETFNLLEPSAEHQEDSKKRFESSDFREPVALFPDPVILEPLEEPYDNWLSYAMKFPVRSKMP